MSQSTPATAPARRPNLGIVAQVLGVLGAIVSVLLVVGIVFGQSYAQERIDVLTNGATEAIDRAIAVSEDVATGLSSATSEVADIKTTAEGLAANPTIDERAFTALIDRLSPLGDRYRATRDRYAALREQATSVMDTVTRLDRLIPGISIPEGPQELVAGIDEKLTALDARVAEIATAADASVGASAAAATIAVQAGNLEAGITEATEINTLIRDRLVALEGQVEDASDTIATMLTVGSIVLAIVLLWGVLLHIALWALGRRWRAA